MPDLVHYLAGRRPVHLWSTVPPHPAFAAHRIRVIRPFAQEFPVGGMLLIGGVHVPVDLWLPYAKPERVALRYNLARHERLFSLVELIRDATGCEPELLFVSRALQLAVGLPGLLEPSLIRLDPFLANPLERPARAFTVGRVSRDVPSKHHPDDPALYRMLAARGMRVRIMGGTCLAPVLGQVPGIELLPAGAEDVSRFYQSLDTMFYRTDGFNEAYGRVVFEAMASGLPVVAHTDGGYAEFIEPGRSGILIQSQEEAFNALLALAGNPVLRRQMGHEARRRAEELHGPHAVEQQVQFYMC